MTTNPDRSYNRRITDLERQITQLRERLDGAVSRASSQAITRDRFLGVTVAGASPGDEYPGPESDTFRVKLLSARFSPETPGPSTITSVERGTIVTARSIPTRYVPAGTHVFVERHRAVGSGGIWWIDCGLPTSTSTFYTFLSGDSQIVSSASSWSYELLNNSSDPDGTPLGNAGEVVGTRTRVVVPGIYLVHGMATLRAEMYSSGGGGGGFAATDWQINLRIFDAATPGQLVEGHANGKASGIEARTSVHALGWLTIREAPSLLGVYLDGRHYNAPLGMEIEDWRVSLLKVAD